MSTKPARSIADQISLLQQRGMQFYDISNAPHYLKNISYYRLKGYWWDMQLNTQSHQFSAGSFFEDVIERYNFDRHFRLILLDAIERIEIALRTNLIYEMSMAHGPFWYTNLALFSNVYYHIRHLSKLQNDFQFSSEIFAVDHKRRYPNIEPEAWKIFEVASFGTLSKFYKNIRHNLLAKSAIANGMGLNLHNELSSWLEAITYVRNIVAHHSRLYSREMVKRPILSINNPSGAWLNLPIVEQQKKRVFLITSCMIYLCNKITPNHQIKSKIKTLISQNPNIQIHKIGFHNNWQNQDLWR